MAARPRGYGALAPNPPRPQLRPLPEFTGSASLRPDSAVQVRGEAFIVEQYTVGRLLSWPSSPTGRSVRCATSWPGGLCTAAVSVPQRWRNRAPDDGSAGQGCRSITVPGR
jgi:hypothetical protein